MSDELNHVTPDDENPAAADETSPVTPVEVAAEPEAEPVAVPAPAPAPAMTTPAPSFWKPIHGIIGLGLLLAIVFLVRGCGGEDAENQEPVTKAKVEETKFAPVQPAVIQVQFRYRYRYRYQHLCLRPVVLATNGLHRAVRIHKPIRCLSGVKVINLDRYIRSLDLILISDR